MIQGAGVHGSGWLPQTDVLDQRFQCVRFDNRGIGESQPQGAELSIEEMALDALAIMDTVGWDSAHVVGHSMGGIIAQQIALTARARVKSLALLCTSARGADATRLSLRIVWHGIRSRIGPRPMRARAFLNLLMPAKYLATTDPDALAGQLGVIVGHSLADSPPIVMRQLKALKRFDATNRLSALGSLRTLVVSAEHDIIFPPRFGKALASGIPGAKYVEIPGAGHGGPIVVGFAAQFNRLLEQHLCGL